MGGSLGGKGYVGDSSDRELAVGLEGIPCLVDMAGIGDAVDKG